MHVSTDLIGHLNTIKADKAMVQVFAARNPDFMTLMRDILKAAERKQVQPLPGTRTLTAVEVAILDNWHNGKPVKGKPVRFGFGLNASTASNVDINAWPFHFCGSLLSRGEFIQKATDLASDKRANPISTYYGDFIRSITEVYQDADGAPDSYLFGPLQAKLHGEGTIYPDQHVLVMKLDRTKANLTVASADLWIGMEENGPLRLAPFVPWFAGNKPVSGKVKLQSRTAPADTMRGWRT